MSAPTVKFKSSAPGSKGKAGNESNTPVPAGEKKDTSKEIVFLAGGKPDKAAYEREQDRIQKEVDVLQGKLTAVREKINSTNQPNAENDRRNALKTELDSIREKQSSKKYNRSQLLEQVKSLQDNLQNKIKTLQAQKSKISFKSVDEMDNHVKSLEKRIESGDMTVADEKRALLEITKINRTRRIVENFQADQATIDSTRQEIDELRKQIDDPEAKALSDRFEAIKLELNEIKKESDEVYAGRSKLFEERDSINAEIKGLLQEKRDQQQTYRIVQDAYWKKVNEDRARRAERQRAQRAEEEARKKLEIVERIREEASRPAYKNAIEDCQTLIDLLSGKSVTKKSDNSLFARVEIASVPKLEVRQVDAVPKDVIVLKKKGEEDDNYFVGGKKGKKGKKGGASKIPNGSAGENGISSTNEKLHISLGILNTLLDLSIPAPDSQADVPRVIGDLNAKKEWLEANQARVTKENIEKAEAEIARLTRQEPKLPGAATPSRAETSNAPCTAESEKQIEVEEKEEVNKEGEFTV